MEDVTHYFIFSLAADDLQTHVIIIIIIRLFNVGAALCSSRDRSRAGDTCSRQDSRSGTNDGRSGIASEWTVVRDIYLHDGCVGGWLTSWPWSFWGPGCVKGGIWEISGSPLWPYEFWF